MLDFLRSDELEILFILLLGYESPLDRKLGVICGSSNLQNCFELKLSKMVVIQLLRKAAAVNSGSDLAEIDRGSVAWRRWLALLNGAGSGH